MTEQEKIEYARTYIEKMANGVDPLTDREIPEGDLLNNVRISRCLFYVSSLLGQLAAQGGPKSPKKPKLPFSLPHEARLEFRPAPQPLPISRVADNINSLIDTEKMEKLSYKLISDWLLEAGFLCAVEFANGKTSRCPTREGTALGITTEERQAPGRNYTVVLYSPEAQQFIVDNLDSITGLAGRKK